MASADRASSTASAFVTRAGLALASLFVALVLCEAALRLFLPKYRGAAEAQMRPDEMRIHALASNTRDWRVHPDTGRAHPFHTNNLGLRQHRDFDEADLAEKTAVGVFGDSWTIGENMDAHYVLTDPLDYLLNLGGTFSVLNFGVGNYGPGQSYLAYRSFHAKGALDYVLFNYYGGNDLRDLARHGLFELDDDGRLRQSRARPSPWWVAFASKLHLTYLAIDSAGRLGRFFDSVSDEPWFVRRRKARWLEETRYRWREGDLSRDDFSDDNLAVFRRLMLRWEGEVEDAGGRFFVVLLPTQPDFPLVRPLLDEAGVDVVDLNACFESYEPGHLRLDWAVSPYRFETDWHWNERANRLAAICLHDLLAAEADLPPLAEDAREAALADYYAAFESASPAEGDAVRRKYQAFSGPADVDPLHGGFARELIIDSEYYDVYVNDRSVVFLREACRADRAHLSPPTPIFIQATPVDVRKLSPTQSYLPQRMRHSLATGPCVLKYRPDRTVPVSHVLVGQRDSAGVLWSGEVLVDRAAFEKTLEAMLAASGRPIIESVMDVHVHGQRLFYVTEDCGLANGRVPFFLHVFPLREADLPNDRAEHGFANLDFHQAGVSLGGRCVVRWHLPDFPIRRIRTGQYVEEPSGGASRIWGGEADLGR